MAFQPYLAVLSLLFFRACTRIHIFPARIGRPGTLFLVLYVLSLIQGSGFVIQLTKISVMALTLVIIAIAVRSQDDFIAGALGLGIGIGILCIRGFINGVGKYGSINPIDGSQKNAFSLYYLPALTLCLYLVFSGRLTIRQRSLFALLITLMFAAVALSTNRSGWVSSAAAVILLFSKSQRRFRMVAFIAIFSTLAYIVAATVAVRTDVQAERDAINAAESDQLRVQLIVSALSIGAQHPLLGVSPPKLTRALSRATKISESVIDCHNLTGYLIGGSGFLTFGAFCLFVFAMLRPPRQFLLSAQDPLATESVRILATLTVIWILRSQFQEDILFSPAFTAGLALCIGLCISTGVYENHRDEGLDREVDEPLTDE